MVCSCQILNWVISELDGGDAEKYAADSVRSAKVTWKKWGKRGTAPFCLNEYHLALTSLLFVGGGF